MADAEGETPKPPRRRTVRSKRGAASFSERLHLHRLEGSGRWREFVPLAERSDREDVRSHKGTSLVGGASGLLVTGLASSAGGTLAGGLTAFGGAVIIKVLSREKRGRGTALAAGFLAGGLVAVVLNAIAGGSLTGTAKLGATMTNLKRLASRIRLQGLGALGQATAVGLLGPREVARLGQLPSLRQFGLGPGPGAYGNPLTASGLGRGLGQELYNPVTEVGLGGLGAGPGPLFEKDIMGRGYRQLSSGPTPPGTGLQPAAYVDGLRGGPPRAARGLGGILDDLLGAPGGGSTVSPNDSTALVLQPGGPQRHIRIPNGQSVGWVVPAPLT